MLPFLFRYAKIVQLGPSSLTGRIETIVTKVRNETTDDM